MTPPFTSADGGADYAFDVFPNPTREYIDVRSERPIAAVSLYDATGRLIATRQEEFRFQLTSLPPAAYSMVVQFMDGKIASRLVTKQ